MNDSPKSYPKRIQLRRTKGWRKPEGAVVVSRPSKWGNWWKVRQDSPTTWGLSLHGGPFVKRGMSKAEATAMAVMWFRWDCRDELIDGDGDKFFDALEGLRGKDLACWCPLDQPCHADVLLELANE